MASDQCISRVIRIFAEEYPRMQVTAERTRLWTELLSDISDEHLHAACLHVVATRPDWPPDLATVRTTALAIAAGQLHPPSGSDAWARIAAKIQGHEIALDAREKKALAQVGTVYDLRRSTNPAADRARFVAAYDGLVQREKAERETLPQVAAANMLALPAKED